MNNSKKTVVVFGANGRVGRLVVEELLRRNYSVRAFVRGEADFSGTANVEVFHGDVYELSDVEHAIEGCDAVISALGSWGTSKKNVLTAGMKNIIPAMEQAQVRRVISLTGADARFEGDRVGAINRLTRPVLLIIAPKILRDGEAHIELLSQSDLDWSVVRSPVMNERGDPNKFTLRIRRPLPWSTINRSSVVLAMVDLLETDEYLQASPFVVRT